MSDIVYRGTVTMERLQELADLYLNYGLDDRKYNPARNTKAISLIEQPDGNWIGEKNRNGSILKERAGDPGTVLTLLITHA